MPRPRKVTVYDVNRVREWLDERRRIGNIKSFAAQIGISETTMHKVIKHIRDGSPIYKERRGGW